MDKLSIIGVILALLALIGGSILKGSGVGGLVNPAAAVIVLIGTIAAILLHTPMRTFKHSMKIVGWVFKPPQLDPAGLIARVVEWSGVARKQGLLALEGLVESESDPFIRKGLQM